MCGRNWSFPASVKIEDSEYLLLHSTKEKLQAGLMCSDHLSPSFGWPLRVLAPGVSPGFLASVALNRIRGFCDFNPVNLYQQQPVFSFVLCFLHVRCTAHCHQQRVRAKLANRANHLSCNRFFCGGVSPSSLAQVQEMSEYHPIMVAEQRN